jgi:hypothetical protein
MFELRVNYKGGEGMWLIYRELTQERLEQLLGVYTQENDPDIESVEVTASLFD